jgi:hypothetical protein
VPGIFAKETLKTAVETPKSTGCTCPKDIVPMSKAKTKE